VDWKNRRRIWGIAKKLEELAIKKGYLLTEDSDDADLDSESRPVTTSSESYKYEDVNSL
jgi:hypothetical protein